MPTPGNHYCQMVCGVDYLVYDEGSKTMNAKITAGFVSVFLITLAITANSYAGLGYISTVEINVDGFICATCVRTIERTLEQEEGVADVSGEWEKGIVGVTVDQKIGWVNLFDFSQRINGTRNYSVLSMNVVAVGRLVKNPVEYYTGGLYAYSGDRYKLQIRDTRKSHFILVRDEKLEELINSGNEIVRVTGTVTSFSDGVPIMRITEFEKLGGAEEPKVLESFAATREALPDHIVSVKLHIDGFICATCVRILESNLLTEEGVASVEADLKTGIVTVTPEPGGEQVDPFYLRRRVNSLRSHFHNNYTVRKMDVEAVGTVIKFPVRYFRARSYTHHHDRYKLQVGNKYFILSENRNLRKLIDSGLKRARVRGTITNTSEGKSILAIGDFKAPGDRFRLGEYDVAEFPEMKIPEKNEHAHIDSIRVYVDGFICATCETPLKNAILLEEGLKIVATDPAIGLIELVPKEGAAVDLFDIEQRINAMREYKILRMDVVASGKIAAVETVYDLNDADSLNPEKNTRYTLSAGESGSFVLADNDKLAEILKSGDKVITAVGTVTAFWGHIPVLDIRDYKKLEKYPEWLQ